MCNNKTMLLCYLIGLLSLIDLKFIMCGLDKNQNWPLLISTNFIDDCHMLTDNGRLYLQNNDLKILINY